jgi:hypothetical protein
MDDAKTMKHLPGLMLSSFLGLGAIGLAVIGAVTGVLSLGGAVGLGALALAGLMVHGTWFGVQAMREETLACGDENEIRMLPEIERLIVHGLLTFFGLVLAVMGGLLGWFSPAFAVTLGVLVILAVTGHGMLFAARHIHDDLPPGKRKRKNDETLAMALGDDGELVDLHDEELQSEMSARA